jgi:tetratricopeptide (TPR) repeat protein
MWELTAVSVAGIAFLALLTGPATAYRGPSSAPPQRPGLRGVGAVVLVAAAPFLIGAQLIPLLAAQTIKDSQAAVARGDGREALSDALAARRLQSWAASTHLQLALVQETLGNLEAAEGSIRTATAKGPDDWRLWLVRARIETKLGRVAEARTSLHRAIELNPRSPLFAGLSED